MSWQNRVRKLIELDIKKEIICRCGRSLPPRQEGGCNSKGQKPTPDPPPIRGTGIPTKSKSDMSPYQN